MDKVPTRDVLVFGGFTDPSTKLNFIVVPEKGTPWRKMMAAVHRMVKPWKDADDDRRFFWSIDGDPDTEKRALWNNKQSRRAERSACGRMQGADSGGARFGRETGRVGRFDSTR